MFEGLAEQVEQLRIPVDGEALAEVIAIADRLRARIAEAAEAFDRARLWDADAATSMTAWLRDRGEMTSREAGRLTAVARRLRDLPVTAEAWRDGSLSGGQVEAILAMLRPATLALFAEHEAELVPALAGLSVNDTVRAMREWKRRADANTDLPEEPEVDRSLYVSQTFEGRRVLDGDLDREGGEVVATALRVAERPDDPDDRLRTAARRRADALVDICRFFLDNQQNRRGGRHRPHLNAVIDLDDLVAGRAGRVLDGPALDGATIQRLFCDSVVHRVVMTGRSAVLDYGSATRTIPAPLWNALVVRDEGCRFPGCDRSTSWCEGHHIVPVTKSGPTRMVNLVLLCTRHHHKLHLPGWHAELLADGTFVVTDPEGRVRSTSPPRALAVA